MAYEFARDFAIRADLDDLIDKLDEEETQIAIDFLANLLLSRATRLSPPPPPPPAQPPSKPFKKGG